MSEIMKQLTEKRERLKELMHDLRRMQSETSQLTAEIMQLELQAITRACAHDFDPAELPAGELSTAYQRVLALRRDRDALRQQIATTPALTSVVSELTWVKHQPGFDPGALDQRSADVWVQTVRAMANPPERETSEGRVTALRTAMVKTAACAVLAIEAIDRQRMARQGEGPDAPR